ncbi:876_t:CDS:2, partial [Racocetra persica]
MRKSLPEAFIFGFTATPKEETYQNIIHSYSMDDALQDEVIVKIVYEIYQYLDLNKIKKNLFLPKSVLPSLQVKGEFFKRDYENFSLNNQLNSRPKVMYIAQSIPTAHEFYKYLSQDPQYQKNICLVTSAQEKEEEKTNIYQFKNTDYVNIAIVVDKLTTGFNLENLQRIYLDQKINSPHRLFQKISRVNRKYPHKNLGFVIDLADNKEVLEETLLKYVEKGVAAIIMANGTLSGLNKKAANIRKNLIENDVVDAIITLPNKLFYSTSIAPCVWIFRKGKKENGILMIDISSDEFGEKVSNNERRLTEKEIKNVSQIYQDFRQKGFIEKSNIPARVVLPNEIRENNYILVPARYLASNQKDLTPEEIDQKLLKTTQELEDLITEQDKYHQELKKLLAEIKKEIESDDQICSLRSGKTPSTKKKEYWCSHEEECDSAQKCKMPLTTESSLLFFHIECLPFRSAQTNTTCNQIISLLEPDLKIVIPNFLYYSLLASKNRLRSIRTGSVQMFTKQTHLASFSLTLPPLPQQQKILSYFQLVYNKIHKTEVQYKDTLIKIIQKHLELGDLLFLKYKDSEIRIEDEFNENQRFAAFEVFLENGTIPWYTQTDISSQTLTPKKFVTLQAVKELSMPLTTKNSILLCNVSEAVAFYPQTSSLSCNQQVFILEPIEGIVEANYLYYLLCAKKKELNSLARGTIFKSLTKSELENFSLSLPPLPQQQKILSYFQLVYNKIHKTEVQYKDTLIKIIQKHLELGDLLFLKYKDSEIRIEDEFKLVRGKTPPSSDYPLQKQKLPLEVVRNYSHLRAKTNYFLALFRLRHSISKAIHDFFHQEGFYYVPTPIITSNDAEGAGEAFTITTDKSEPFFSQPANLTVSGQLHAEALAQGLEPEISFADLEAITNLAERMIKYLVNYVLINNKQELEYFAKYNKKELINKLKKITDEEFKKIDYHECIKILAKNKKNYNFSDIEWETEVLQTEHEKYLCQYFGGSPVFVINYPCELKAFYMKNNPDGKTVACFDLLFPEIGELIGGGLREDDYKTLQKKADKQNLDTDDLRKALEVEGVAAAKKCLRALQNGTVTAFGGRFRGISYDKNAKRMIKQAQRSLKEAIKKHEKGENVDIKEVAIVPASYYCWGVIVGG